MARDATGGAQLAAPREFDRLTVVQRLQHILLVVSCLVLVVTGLPVLFHEGGAPAAAVRLVGGASARAVLHRVGAVALMAVCAWHLLYIILSRRAHEDFLRVLPRRQDARDARLAVRMYLGLNGEGPRFGRFSYVEKMQYWAVALGCLMMILSGLAMWFHDQVMLTLPKFWLDVAWIVHGRGAILGFLAIIVWHLYNVHLRPGVFPMSWAWLTGRIPAEQMRADHALEYEAAVAGTGGSRGQEGESPQ